MSFVYEMRKLPWNISTAITLLGLFFLPLLIKTIGQLDFYLWSAVVLLLDLIDGGLARLLGQENYSRRLVDTIKDKIVFFTILIYLYGFNMIEPFLFWWTLAYFSVLLVGGYLSYYYMDYLPASDNLGRVSILCLLGLVGYFYLTSTNNPSRLFMPEPSFKTVFIATTLVLNISTIVNYSLNIVKKNKPST